MYFSFKCRQNWSCYSYIALHLMCQGKSEYGIWWEESWQWFSQKRLLLTFWQGLKKSEALKIQWAILPSFGLLSMLRCCITLGIDTILLNKIDHVASSYLLTPYICARGKFGVGSDGRKVDNSFPGKGYVWKKTLSIYMSKAERNPLKK